MLGGNLRKGSRNRRLRQKDKWILLPSTAQETLELLFTFCFGMDMFVGTCIRVQCYIKFVRLKKHQKPKDSKLSAPFVMFDISSLDKFVHLAIKNHMFSSYKSLINMKINHMFSYIKK